MYKFSKISVLKYTRKRNDHSWHGWDERDGQTSVIEWHRELGDHSTHPAEDASATKKVSAKADLPSSRREPEKMLPMRLGRKRLSETSTGADKPTVEHVIDLVEATPSVKDAVIDAKNRPAETAQWFARSEKKNARTDLKSIPESSLSLVKMDFNALQSMGSVEHRGIRA